MRCADMRDLIAHHIVALADGGPDTPENCVTLCGVCHAEWHAIEGTRRPFEDFLETVPTVIMQEMMALSEREEFSDLTAKEMNESWARMLWVRIRYNQLSRFGARSLSVEELAADPLLELVARLYRKR
jgi:hypothetical protein